VKSIVRRAGAILTGAALVAALAACGAQQPATPSVSTLKMNVGGFVLAGNWNPVTSSYLNVYFWPQQAVYESFIRFDPATFEWVPQLAESYEISDDQLSMRITLREDVDFSDGTHLDAEAAKKSFDYSLSGEAGGYIQLRDQYAPQIEVTGEYELLVTSTGAMTSDFLFWFGIVPIASPTAIEDDPTGLEEIPVGTGPYLFDEEVPDASATFVRNPDYRDPDAYPYDEIEFIVFDDPIAVSNALKSGQLNAAETAIDYAADLESNGFDLHVGVGGPVVLLWTDPQGTVVPELADVRVRQAIAFALDRAAINETLESGYGTVTSQAWGKGSPYYIEGADETYAYDIDRARELMAEAGYADGFEIAMPSLASLAKYEPVIAQSLADIGITVTYETFADITAWAAAADGGDYALTFRETSDLFLSDPLRRTPNGGHPEINALYEVVDTGTKQEAEAAFQEIGHIVLDEALVIAVSRTASIWATDPAITLEPVIVGWPVQLGTFQRAG
jgi:peptide/nickel transport system substrate-binding protein